ncbi:MAG: Bax inhibitor-1 family protein [Candidatus Gracilibacteria bacterium]|nr:Bax inhibitor-1 family protein [Candidatus Gracilibacteria bacterium]
MTRRIIDKELLERVFLITLSALLLFVISSYLTSGFEKSTTYKIVATIFCIALVYGMKYSIKMYDGTEILLSIGFLSLFGSLFGSILELLGMNDASEVILASSIILVITFFYLSYYTSITSKKIDFFSMYMASITINVILGFVYFYFVNIEVAQIFTALIVVFLFIAYVFYKTDKLIKNDYRDPYKICFKLFFNI